MKGAAECMRLLKHRAEYEMYADVIFPLKLKPLTYHIPIDIQSDLKGSVVEAPLMGRRHYGIVKR